MDESSRKMNAAALTAAEAKRSTPPAADAPLPDGSSSASSPQPPQPPAATTEDRERLKAEAREAKEQYLRALAEFENTRKRLHREKEEFARYAAEAMVRKLLPILDGFEQALVVVDQASDAQSIIKGLHLIYRQVLGLLEDEGVKRISSIGEPFDPHRHESVGHVQAKNGQADGTIGEEVRVGYLMHDKVLRPALVKVAKTPDRKSEARGQQSEMPPTSDS